MIPRHRRPSAFAADSDDPVRHIEEGTEFIVEARLWNHDPDIKGAAPKDHRHLLLCGANGEEWLVSERTFEAEFEPVQHVTADGGKADAE